MQLKLVAYSADISVTDNRRLMVSHMVGRSVGLSVCRSVGRSNGWSPPMEDAGWSVGWLVSTCRVTDRPTMWDVTHHVTD